MQSRSSHEFAIKVFGFLVDPYSWKQLHLFAFLSELIWRLLVEARRNRDEDFTWQWLKLKTSLSDTVT